MGHVGMKKVARRPKVVVAGKSEPVLPLMMGIVHSYVGLVHSIFYDYSNLLQLEGEFLPEFTRIIA